MYVLLYILPDKRSAYNFLSLNIYVHAAAQLCMYFHVCVYLNAEKSDGIWFQRDACVVVRCSQGVWSFCHLCAGYIHLPCTLIRLYTRMYVSITYDGVMLLF